MNSIKKSTTAKFAKIGEYGEDLYDFAKASQWRKADRFLTRLQKSYSGLNSSSGSNSGLISRLGQRISALSQAIGSRDAANASQVANQITFDAAKFTAQANAPVPLAVTLLDYYGRELELGSTLGNLSVIQKNVGTIRQTWNAVRSSVLDNDGASEVKTFDGLIKRLKVDQSFAQYGRLATMILDEVDHLETVFRTPEIDNDEEKD
jgi:hypothetical protein